MSKSLVSGLIYIVIGIVIIIAVFQFFQKSDQKQFPYVTDVTKDVSGIHVLKIESAVTALSITESEDEFLYASLEQANNNAKNALTLLVNNNSDVLSLEVVKQNQNSIFSLTNLNHFNSKLNVKVPKQFNGKLEIVTTTGGTHINYIDVETLKVETTTGALKLNSINSNDVEIESTTGSIHVNNVTANKLKAESTTGSIRLDSNLTSFDVESTTGSIHFTQDDIIEDSKLTSTTGSIHVSLNQAPQSLLVKFESSTGNAQIKTTGHNMIQNSRNEQEFQFGSGQTKLNVETTTGSFHFN